MNDRRINNYQNNEKNKKNILSNSIKKHKIDNNMPIIQLPSVSLNNISFSPNNQNQNNINMKESKEFKESKESSSNLKSVFTENNAIILPQDRYNNISIKEKPKKRPSSAKNDDNDILIDNTKIIKKNKFRIKNALSSNHGKEFTIKINNSLFKKCHNKYSGGPETIKYLKTETEKKVIDEKKSYFVNYYNLVEPNTGNTFLHIAALENIPKMAKYFVEKGANLNLQNNEGNTPLHLALKCKNNEVIKILMDGKAALDIPNSKGEIPFEYFTLEMKKEYGVDTMLVLNPTKKK